MTRVVRLLFRAALISDGDPFTLLVLADALEDERYTQLSAAYRYAGENNLWPFKLHYMSPFNFYDWDTERDDLDVPERAKLPRTVFYAVCQLDKRRYGGVNRAFKLLARALEHVQ